MSVDTHLFHLSGRELSQTAVRVEVFVDSPPSFSEWWHKSVVSCLFVSLCGRDAVRHDSPPGKRVKRKRPAGQDPTRMSMWKICVIKLIPKKGLRRISAHTTAHATHLCTPAESHSLVLLSENGSLEAGFDGRFERAEILKRFCCRWSCLSASLMDKKSSTTRSVLVQTSWKSPVSARFQLTCAQVRASYSKRSWHLRIEGLKKINVVLWWH